MKVGVLALQGDVREHIEVLRSLDVAAVPVVDAATLETVDAVVLPGGESTTISKLLAEHGMLEPLRKRLDTGLPAFGTCAGAILLAGDVTGGDVAKLGVLDVAVERNAYGRQVSSFEADVEVTGVGTVHGVFIRAPVVTTVGEAVEVLGTHRDAPVVLRQGHLLASTFHPEIAEDPALHRFFCEVVCPESSS